MENKARVLTQSVFASLILTGVMFGLFFTLYSQNEPPQAVAGLLWPNPKQIDEFTLVDQNGEDFSLDDLKGHWSFLFFGYTHCPDVCPVTMTLMNGVYNQLTANNALEDVQVIFVTVDPARDTTQRLQEYMGFFNRDFIGLGGSMEQVETLVTQIGIVYLYGAESDTGEYLVDHTSSLFLLAPDASLVSIISPPYTVESILERFDTVSTFLSSQPGN